MLNWIIDDREVGEEDEEDRGGWERPSREEGVLG